MLKSTKSKYIAALFTLTAAFAAHTEWTGYSAFDREDGSNFLCDIDPSCRYLTQGEIELAQRVFGDSIDYSRVKVFNRSFFGPFTSDRPMAPNGNIYYQAKLDQSPDYSKEYQLNYMHEMTHIWQDHSGQNVIGMAYHAMREHNGVYDYAYDYDADNIPPFAEMGLEQQAMLIEDMTWDLLSYNYVLGNTYPYSVRGVTITLEDALDETCSNLAKQNTSLNGVFPPVEVPACQTIRMALVP